MSLHMAFLGNPGTAKTTVARLFARILKKDVIIKNPEIVEVGRFDLVSAFVGGTAPLVKSQFMRAKGGILFIDESYVELAFVDLVKEKDKEKVKFGFAT